MTAQPSETARRAEQISAFLTAAGWSGARRVALTADASTRRYERLFRGDETALLMDAPPAAESAPCPPQASTAERLSLGYNAVARLAGPDSRRFAAFSSELRHRGLRAPTVLAAEYDQGLLLIEDFGDDLLAAAIARGAPERLLYEGAIDALLHLHEGAAPAEIGRGDGPRSPLLEYDALAYAAETDLLTEWLYPLLTGRPMEFADAEDYRALWRPLLAQVAPSRPVIVLRDFHAENLLWMPQYAGLDRVGLIDFQDGLRGHPAYDLISLIEDARRDVAPALADAMMARYIAGASARPGFSAEEFKRSAAILGCQRNSKILGIFARLYVRDGKPKYLGFIPRLWDYMDRDLAHGELSGLKAWFDRVFPPALRVAPHHAREGVR